MTLAQFQSYHIERHAFLWSLIAYDAAYHAHYSLWQLDQATRARWGFPPRRLHP